MSESPKRELLLKELDHLQAVVGRYDSFFFLAKQLCLAAIAYLIFQYQSPAAEKNPYLIMLPFVFFLMEISFRFTYWAWSILRIGQVRELLLGNDVESAADCEIYRMAPTEDDVGYRFQRSLQQYDMWFYGLILTSALVYANHYGLAVLALMILCAASVAKRFTHLPGLGHA
jgi:hypothetical protein